MKTVFKIAWGNIKNSGARAVVTLIGVTLAVTIIAFVSILCASMEAELPHISEVLPHIVSRQDIKHWKAIFSAFTAMICAMSCVMIYSAFSIIFSGRTKVIGLLASVGASPLQKSLTVFTEALIYGAAAMSAGLPLGAWLAKEFYGYGAGIMFSGFNGELGIFTFSASSLCSAARRCLFTITLASVIPMIKIKRVSVMDSISGRTKINISLRQGLFARLTERVFGYYGRLAGQNYENNKGTYHGLSLTLSGGVTMFYVIYSFFMYMFRFRSIDDLWGTRDVRFPTPTEIVFGFRLDGEYAASQDPTSVVVFSMFMALAFVFVAISLICASGGASVSMDRRRGEHAMLKSIGMQNSELCRVMCIECVYLTFYSALYGLIGSIAADAVMTPLFSALVDEPLLGFWFPVMPYLLFVLLDIVVGLLFAVYAIFRIRRVNIIETIRNRDR